MRREKYLTVALCCCGLALCVAVGIAFHFRQESRERQELLTAAQEQIKSMETELAQAGEQLVLAEEAKAEAEKERDYAQRQYEWATERDNPIDRYYYGTHSGGSTAEMSSYNAFFYDAWKQELSHAIEVIVEEMELNDEEKGCLEKYRESVERAAGTLAELNWLMYEKGHIGTLVSPNAVRSAADVYRNNTLNLLDTYYFAFGFERYYCFAFDDIFVKEWKEKNGGGLTSSGEQMFPPLLQVLPASS